MNPEVELANTIEQLFRQNGYAEVVYLLKKALAEQRKKDAQILENFLAENDELRRMLAFAYSGVFLYCDDGELQDNRTKPIIDFRRDSFHEIKRKMGVRVTRALREAKEKHD